MVPVTERDVQSEPGKNRAGLSRCAGEFLSRTLDPEDCILRAPGFPVTVDRIQMCGVEALAIGILINVLLVARGRFGPFSHSQQRRSREIGSFTALFCSRVVTGDPLVHLPGIVIASLLIKRPG